MAVTNETDRGSFGRLVTESLSQAWANPDVRGGHPGPHHSMEQNQCQLPDSGRVRGGQLCWTILGNAVVVGIWLEPRKAGNAP